MSNPFQQAVRMALQRAETQAYDAVVPLDLIFDDASLEEVLYAEQPPKHTEANIFREVRNLFRQLDEAHRRSELAVVIEKAEALKNIGYPLPPDVFERLAMILSLLPSQASDAGSRHDRTPAYESLVFWWTEAIRHGNDRMQAHFGIPLAFQLSIREHSSECRRTWKAQAEAQRTVADDLWSLFVINALQYWQVHAINLRDKHVAHVGLLLRQFFYDGGDLQAPSNEIDMCTEQNGIDLLEPLVVEALIRLAQAYAGDGPKARLEWLHHLTILVGVAPMTAGAEHPMNASCLNLLVRFLQEGSEYHASVPVARRALHIRERTLGAFHALVAQSLNNLGLSLYHCGFDVESEETLRRAAEINSRFPNPHYWLALLYQRRRASRDGHRELAAWRRYKELGPTTPERAAEADRRIEELEDVNG